MLIQVCGFHVYAHDFTRQVGGRRKLDGMNSVPAQS